MDCAGSTGLRDFARRTAAGGGTKGLFEQPQAIACLFLYHSRADRVIGLGYLKFIILRFDPHIVEPSACSSDQFDLYVKARLGVIDIVAFCCNGSCFAGGWRHTLTPLMMFVFEAVFDRRLCS